ncbi:polyisoprenoid-binding protein [Ktedonosporobacter rubrisoli]|uniref:Polyisoprenoid-binding protein n=2 Tax=Ktedonosporobacter rubrisoli TaxID=2509675 RepID=A0A4P6K5X3_KTERU|nr:polyisoprenoid-binding protein [Ktedonosporobacter rubrisoli]
MAWEIDAAHSQATFAVKHMMISTVKGHFNVLRGQLHIDEQNPDNSWIEAEVDAASIDTRDENRDNHLRTGDFLEVEKYPTINFKSTKVEHIDGDEYKVLGNLTLRGVTREVIFKAEYSGQGKDPWGGTRAGLSAKGKIDRRDFGLTFNTALETGGVLVGEEVKIEIDLEAVQK